MTGKVSILICFVLPCLSCNKTEHLFKKLSPKSTGITFANTITERDTLNIFDNEFVYNGGGVAIGDVNGDALPDVYFTGNQVDNQLYLNRGGMKFTDITAQAKVGKMKDQWSTGVTMVDINRDGKLDIYVCNSMSPDKALLRDNLFINQGNDQDGLPEFKEMGKAYGILDNTHNSISTFFDYDRDGDLDLFIAVNFIDMQYPNLFITKMKDGSAPTKDILYRNDAQPGQQPHFTDVSLEAGIVWGGYSHSCLIQDFNQDGWPDIYVANDYISNDLIYINNQDGTFTNRIKDIFKHQSYSSMGSDAADINNDGLEDIFTAEMLPKDNKRKKVNLNANNYTMYLFNEEYGYEYQYVRNTFQLNQGLSPETGLPVFADIAFLAGVEATEWSWSPLFADFDNDGWRDLLVTNGFPKDVTDHDFGAFRKSINSSLVSRDELHQMIPEVKVPNFMFRNRGNLSFQDVSAEWGVNVASFSNGTAYADLDNDGDLDFVVNNIDEVAGIFQNTLYSKKNKAENKPHYLRVSLSGDAPNPDGYGAKVSIWYVGKQQLASSSCIRGYLSKSENTIHFGLGKYARIDSLRITWPDQRSQLVKNVQADQTLRLVHKDATDMLPPPRVANLGFLKEVQPNAFGIDYVHEENDFIDFNFQRTLPHKFSQYGPGLAVGDVNQDGLDDMVLGSTSRFPSVTLLLQTKAGKFTRGALDFKKEEPWKEEDMGLLLFDADLDGDNDLYIVRGSNQHAPNSPDYQDILCINDGKGNFKVVPDAIPAETASGQAVKAADYDRDGDLDLFVGGRVAPHAYPLAGHSFVLRNDSKNGRIKFTDVTLQLCPELANIGMVSDAIWTDFDKDQKVDLILAGEWMPLTFLKNQGNKFANITGKTGIADQIGWWNSLSAGDFDNDGDIDYVAGNFGLNTYFKCSNPEPLRIYAKDFDGNGNYDPFISCYFADSTGKKHEYFFHTKDDMQKQLILIRNKYEKYADFGRATVQDVFTKEEMQGVQKLEANNFQSSMIENLGQGHFKIWPLPIEAQLAPVYGIQTKDLNQDGYIDLLMVGNDFGMEIGQGRADAFNGLILLNKKNKTFRPLTFSESQFFVPFDARALAKCVIKGKEVLVATQNRKGLKMFEELATAKLEKLLPQEAYGFLNLQDGRRQKLEFNYGATFLSQDSRTVVWGKEAKSLETYDAKGNKIRQLK